jgi:hypothetical protein
MQFMPRRAAMPAEILQDEQSWPNLSTAARLLGVSKATLSKQAKSGRVAVRVVGLGRGSKHILSPQEVLRLGRSFGRVPPATLRLHLAELLAARQDLPTQTLLRELDRVDVAAGPVAEVVGDERRDGMMTTAPTWMTQVDHLVAHPELLAGTLTLASPDEPHGRAVIGRVNLDNVALDNAEDWAVVPVAPRSPAYVTARPGAGASAE